MSFNIVLLLVFIALVYSQETCKVNEANAIELTYLLTLAEIAKATNNISLIKQYEDPVIYEKDGFFAFTTNIKVNHPKEGLINAFVVAYQGTNLSSIEDIKADLESIILVDFKLKSSEIIGKAGEGFIEYYETIINTQPTTKYTTKKPNINYYSLFDNIIEATKTFKYVIVTGHSLGGAVAHLSAIDLFKSFSISHDFKVLLATFGSPRIFEKHTALRILDSISIENYRVVNSYDPIPLLPPPDLLLSQFHHIGLPIAYVYNNQTWIKSNDNDFGGFDFLSIDTDYHFLKGDKGYIAHLNKSLELDYCV